jgi:single-stranded DNA-specific DHH superfamily exonuclease
MSQLISARLPENTAERMRQYARRKQRSLNEMMATAVEEWLRQNEFAYIEFRDTPDGRIAYMKGSRLTVAWVIKIAKGLDNDIARIIGYFGEHRSADWVQAAFNYYAAFREEIDAQIADIESQTFETLKRRLPQLELISVGPSKAQDAAE